MDIFFFHLLFHTHPVKSTMEECCSPTLFQTFQVFVFKGSKTTMLLFYINVSLTLQLML